MHAYSITLCMRNAYFMQAVWVLYIIKEGKTCIYLKLNGKIKVDAFPSPETLTHLSRMELPILIIWTSPFSF